MGGRSSKTNAVKPEPIPTTVTVQTTVHTMVSTTVADMKPPEVKCWIDNHEILYVSLAFISGILSAVLVFAIIYLCRKKCKRSHQTLQEQLPSQTVTEESEKNAQNEVAYTTLVFQRGRTPVAV
ncbi:transmembrane protein C1orf162 homolog [Caloenas nicobarica]|uniref:transmembrane protein C1orf162 homolog n=1 Tax=Caloenas nicobarica TaxID=187106 RepID=UPI0032B83237